MHLNLHVAWLYWNPPREAFVIPFLDHPVAWYGVLFVVGFLLAYFVIHPILSRFLIETRQISSLDIVDGFDWIARMRTPSPSMERLISKLKPSIRQELKRPEIPAVASDFQRKVLEDLNRLLQEGSITREELQEAFGSALATPSQTAFYLADRLAWCTMLGTLIGARLGVVFFYDWSYFRAHPAEIFQIWHGGLASHGGFAGVILALYFYTRYIQRWIPQLTFLHLLDFVAIPATLVSVFIRLGNFVNQEIVGLPTTLPWGILFGQPIGGPAATPLHPVQLYEAALYLFTFGFLWRLWKRQDPARSPGALVGWSFVLGFGGRFILEFWKATQDSMFSSFFLEPGQILSLPFILVGIYLIWRPAKVCVIR